MATAILEIKKITNRTDASIAAHSIYPADSQIDLYQEIKRSASKISDINIQNLRKNTVLAVWINVRIDATSMDHQIRQKTMLTDILAWLNSSIGVSNDMIAQTYSGNNDFHIIFVPIKDGQLNCYNYIHGPYDITNLKRSLSKMLSEQGIKLYDKKKLGEKLIRLDQQVKDLQLQIKALNRKLDGYNKLLALCGNMTTCVKMVNAARNQKYAMSYHKDNGDTQKADVILNISLDAKKYKEMHKIEL